MVTLVDFGSQTAHLISRRIRELGGICEIINSDNALEKIKKSQTDGIIFSGGPASVYEKDSPTIDKKIFELGIPILGICYGQQLMCHLLGGRVKPGEKKEYGPAELRVQVIGGSGQLTKDVPSRITVWMSHGDEVVKIPAGFKRYGITKTIPHAVIADEKRKIYGIQFHPEVVHTEYGMKFLENFLKICGMTPKKSEIDKKFVDSLIKDIADSLGNEKAICALSGGVDSSVAALLVHKAVGKSLISIYVDSGLMRQGETDTLREVFGKYYKMDIQIIDAKKEFLKALKGITDPEQKRKVIGKIFIEVFEKEAKEIKAKFLVQGTIYPDVIESAGTKHAQNIKSHHNVGGLPENMNLFLIEPLRNFYKDEVRIIGEILGLPKSITQRQPFPGPGLAVRIIGEVTAEKLKILRKADAIVQEGLKDIKLWQAFAVFTGIKTTGVRGDQRAYGETIAIRAIEAKDAMSANFAHLPYEVLEKISVRIVTEVPEVNRVVYDITTKPPATMEWE
ncbi:glutamine-hydrolyzing GMP synthase [Candidatus Daviesbacteria bacterium RIFCSPLOWO2_01_FULL_39_12]|uniref:GMP synthase [glutamine-hydrolyzing] n=1 Tax=Candidatus Daviesbacteria bacterium RIFCSPLOWO2_01_FULL_39_12 TaxID=1797785 RepID=A0A1F5KU72_9BACT|nr:MAG: glutamine-hydrolyzing GMP synthase [Candidatus Daviesbacteria bacterium RIFCSPHIGHO2_02_FULL_39_8]OGE44389.1 MAG: glutamine-hydrolyzing GMP synthase [Candidatus Daviesbacteria bacterium RIFCSPLOWO2_01_FULL_39_12]